MSFGSSKVPFVLQEIPIFDYKAMAMGENMFKPEHRRYSETLFWIFHWNHTTETTDFIALWRAFKIDFCVFRKCEEIAEHTLNAIKQKFACDQCQSYGWQINETLCTGHVRYSELATKININLLRPSDAYTAHKKFMNGFACRVFDPYVAIISTSRCQKTPVCKSAK